MNISEMASADIHEELKSHDVKVHHKTGIDKLRSTLEAVRAGTYEAPVEPDQSEPLTGPAAAAGAPVPTEALAAAEKPAPTTKPAPAGPKVKVLTKEQHAKKLTKEQRALALVRIVVSPNDPLMSSHPGLIFTVGSSAVNNGKMIKKYVPFNNDEGWHVPQMIVDQIEAAQMQKFRSVKMPNGEKGLQAYITKKFNVQILDPLDVEEMSALAAAQKSRGDT